MNCPLAFPGANDWDSGKLPPGGTGGAPRGRRRGEGVLVHCHRAGFVGRLYGPISRGRPGPTATDSSPSP